MALEPLGEFTQVRYEGFQPVRVGWLVECGLVVSPQWTYVDVDTIHYLVSVKL